MLAPGNITREELYEAVWSEPIQKLAKALQISDVGLAKICRKLQVPLPGRGYWAKNPASRKLLRMSLPSLKPGQESTRWIGGSSSGPAGWTREALQQLAEEGVSVPTVALPSAAAGTHPLISAYRDQVSGHGLEVSQLLVTQPCLAVSASSALLERSLGIIQRLFEALEAKGYQPEVLPPNPHELNRYGYGVAAPSRTGTRIKGVFVAFELKEAFSTVEVPPPAPGPQKARTGSTYEPPPRPFYQKVGSGRLMLEIVSPAPDGMRRRWQDRAKRKLEDDLDAFLRAVMAIAEHEHQAALRREREQEEAARQAELVSRMWDLESRIMDMQQAQAIRGFVQAVKADAEARGIPVDPSTEAGVWVAWAQGLAAELERAAVQTLADRRRKPAGHAGLGSGPAQQAEASLRGDVDLWRRRYIFGRH